MYRSAYIMWTEKKNRVCAYGFDCSTVRAYIQIYFSVAAVAAASSFLFFFLLFLYIHLFIVSTPFYPRTDSQWFVCLCVADSLFHRKVCWAVGTPTSQDSFLRSSSTHSYLRQITISFSHLSVLFFFFRRSSCSWSWCCCSSFERREKKIGFYFIQCSFIPIWIYGWRYDGVDVRLLLSRSNENQKKKKKKKRRKSRRYWCMRVSTNDIHQKWLRMRFQYVFIRQSSRRVYKVYARSAVFISISVLATCR